MGTEVSPGEEFYFDPAKYYQALNKTENNCVGDIKAKLVSIQDGSITIEKIEQQVLNGQFVPYDKENDSTQIIKNGTCLVAPPLCMDAIQNYCFSVGNLEGKDEFVYQIEERSTMPTPFNL